MKAKISITLKSPSAEEAQELLNTLCEGLVADGSIESCTFEIETEMGIVTEKCILSGERVIA